MTQLVRVDILIYDQMAYATFQEKRLRSMRPAVSICRRGTIMLNPEASRLFHGKGTQCVLFQFDATERMIAVRASTDTDKNSYRVTYSRDFRRAVVCAKSFLLRYGWDGEKYNIDANWIDEEAVLEFPMSVWKDSQNRNRLPALLGVEHQKRRSDRILAWSKSSEVRR